MAACRMNDEFNAHQAVMLVEVIQHLAIKPDGVYLDVTFGRGGHAQAILNQLGPTGRLLAMDKDPEAVAYASQHFSTDKRFAIYHGAFSKLAHFARAQNVSGKIDGILFDLGVSSPQLDNPDRGFSFMRKGKLDMRMDSSKGTDAADLIANTSEKELADLLWHYGEERFARRIARAIVAAREVTPIVTTAQLADIVAKAIPAWPKGKHPATRSFQAIRIAVNQELEELERGLAQGLEVLCVGGRLLIISFHSLEDRLVKHFMQQHERGQALPARFPIKQADINIRFKRIGRAIKPDTQEIAGNPRARSAVLRIGEKLS